jgi:O-antigen ligase
MSGSPHADVAGSAIALKPGGLSGPIDSRAPGTQLGYAVWQGRLFLMIALVAAAMPIRLAVGVPVVDSISILDIVLLVAALTLFLDLSYRPLDTGYTQVFGLLCLPLAVATLSIVWSQDRPATLRAMLIYVEGLIAYLFVVRELHGLSPARIVGYLERFAYLLIIPAVLLLLHVPGFGPRVSSDITHSSGAYQTYFTRLSHPVLGASNNLATILAFFAPILIYWGHVQRNRRITVAGLVAAAAIFVTLSRGVLLSFLIAGVLYAILSSGSRTTQVNGLGRKIAGIVALGAVAIAAFYVLNPQTHEQFKTRLTLTNVISREALISDALTKIANRPLLGYGGGASPDRDPSLLAEHVHNTFLQQAVYFGIPLGVLVSAALIGLAGFFLARRRRAAIAGVLAYVLLVQLVSYTFEASFEGTVLRVLFYMSIGMAVALLRSVESERPAAPG